MDWGRAGTADPGQRCAARCRGPLRHSRTVRFARALSMVQPAGQRGCVHRIRGDLGPRHRRHARSAHRPRRAEHVNVTARAALLLRRRDLRGADAALGRCVPAGRQRAGGTRGSPQLEGGGRRLHQGLSLAPVASPAGGGRRGASRRPSARRARAVAGGGDTPHPAWASARSSTHRPRPTRTS